jgi:hypothetical protein
MALQMKKKFEGLGDIIVRVMGQLSVPFRRGNGPAVETQASQHNESKHVRGRRYRAAKSRIFS